MKLEKLAKWWDIITYSDSSKYTKFIAWLFLNSFVASIPSSILMIAVYYLLAPILDSTKAYEQAPFWILTGILLLQTAAYAVIRRKSYLDICVGHVSAQQNEKLRLGDKLKTLPMGYFATHDVGELSTLLMRNYEEIENLSSSIVANGAVILIRLLIALVVLSIFNVKMTLAMFIVIPLAIPFAVISYKRVAHTSAELIAIQQQTAANVVEYAGGITTLQAYDRTGSAFAGLKDSFAKLRDDSKRQEKAGGALSMYGRAILFLGISIVMGVGAHLLSTGEISPFFYIMCLLAALQVYEPIMQLFVFVISISMVFQDVYLFKDTIAENIRLGKPDATEAEIIAAARSAACHDFIESLPDGYGTMVGEGGSTLSGGEKQRISIARAILSAAPIVFLDEATASLDPENEVLIQRAIDELVKNKTVLVIAHRLQSVMNADEIIVLDDGRIAEQGTHSELLKKGGRYAALWENQQRAGNWKLT